MPPLPSKRGAQPPRPSRPQPPTDKPPTPARSAPSATKSPRLDPSAIDWRSLRQAAAQAAQRAYAPYSKLQVGAAGLTDDGRIVVGCNVENASYGLTLCAECGMVSALHASGGGRLVAVCCIDGSGTPLTPCGRCRQLLHEHGGPSLLVDGAQNVLTIDQLLPGAFTPVDLPR